MFLVFNPLNNLPLVLVFLLISEDVWNFDLSPCEVTFLVSFRDGPPTASLHQPLHKEFVIAWADIHFQRLGILLGRLDLDVVGEVEFPDEVPVIKSLKRRHKWFLLRRLLRAGF